MTVRGQTPWHVVVVFVIGGSIAMAADLAQHFEPWYVRLSGTLVLAFLVFELTGFVFQTIERLVGFVRSYRDASETAD